MHDGFICPVCGNKDPRLIGTLNGKPYCRKCVCFRGEEASNKYIPHKNAGYKLKYELSNEQKVLSKKIVDNFINGIDTLVYAVCGSGKTEISYDVICYAMAKGMHVGFALPRRDVVVELFERIQDAFPSSKVVAVYGGHCDVLEGDCIVLTTHQLYRYPNYFDLLVMDEIDAFPFKDNEVLQAFYKNSLRGHCLLMSATPSKKVVDSFKGKDKCILTLHTRFHKKPIPEPRMMIAFSVLKTIKLIALLKRYEKERKPALVFVPSIEQSKSLAFAISLFIKGGTYINSQRKDRTDVIRNFKKGIYHYLVTTAVLERGVTIANCQVVVYDADSYVYNAATLVQIAGRAGRKANHPDGDVVFIGETKTEAMQNAIKEIQYCNTFLQGVHETF